MIATVKEIIVSINQACQQVDSRIEKLESNLEVECDPKNQIVPIKVHNENEIPNY